jgi:hypothetical protein
MSKVYVITDSTVRVYNSMNKLKDELKIETSELTKVGKDYVCSMTDQSFEISKDIKLLETVGSRKVFSKEKMDSQGWMLVLIILMAFLIYTRLPSSPVPPIETPKSSSVPSGNGVPNVAK